MKHITSIMLILMLLASCTQNVENRVNSLIKKEMNKTLVDVNSYDPVETKIDTAYTPYDDPQFLKTINEMAEEAAELNLLQRKADLVKSYMAIYDSPYSSFSRNEYQRNKKEYEEYEKQISVIRDRGKKKAETIKPMLEKEPTNIGFKVAHKFRYKNSSGQTAFGNVLFIIDKEIKTILASYDMNGMEYQLLELEIKEIKELRGSKK